MNPWSNQLGAQIVNRMQREGVEVVESPFEREWQPGPLSRLVIVAWRALVAWRATRSARRVAAVEASLSQR